jgi:Tfp pilus assembly protein PilN
VRPVNLIPVEQRRGAARSMGGRRNATPVYFLLGGLGVAVLGVFAFVLTSNQVSSKTNKLAEVRQQEQSEKAVADTLRPYGDFAQLASSRTQQIEQIAHSRFDWANSLGQISLAIPSNVWLLNVSGTVSPDVELEASGGDAGNMRGDVPGPALTLTGCAFSQHSVARMMSRMRNVDSVTRVTLVKSSLKDDQGTTGATATSAGATDQQQQQDQNAEDCNAQGRDAKRVTTFSLLLELGAAAQTGASAGAGVPQGYSAQVAGAQAAVSQANSAAATAAGGGQ